MNISHDEPIIIPPVRVQYWINDILNFPCLNTNDIQKAITVLAVNAKNVLSIAKNLEFNYWFLWYGLTELNAGNKAHNINVPKNESVVVP